MQERLKPIIYRLQLAAYDLEMNALEQTITNILLFAEASRRNVGPETIIRTEVSEKVKPATDAEVNKFYEENKSKLNGDLNSLRPQLANYLESQETQRLERALGDRLRKDAKIQYLITEPQPPVQTISVDDDPARGPATAPVTIVEFTDFQCPSCAAMHPILEEALKSYGAKVRFVVRDFPLNVHANAHKAAEAANAANAQGKFFEYAALLFQRQKALDVASLKKYATELGLDRAKFDLALDKGSYAAEVGKDIQDGEMYGVEATPTIFINGRMLMNLSAEGLREAIDRALAAPTTKATN
jgi:protein-disulfide isomerase